MVIAGGLPLNSSTDRNRWDWRSPLSGWVWPAGADLRRAGHALVRKRDTGVVDFALYPAASTAMLALSLAASERDDAAICAVLFLCGLAAWPLVEYAIHRFAYHRVAGLADLHGLHHDNPGAAIGVPSWLSLVLFVLAGFVPLWPLLGAPYAAAVLSGLMLGYGCYIALHHAVHRWPLGPSSLLYRAKLRHLRHHREEDCNFGVTSEIWDRVFGTRR